MSASFQSVEKHLSNLRRLKEKLDQASDAYVRKSLADSLSQEAEAAGKAVKGYIEAGGDPQLVAEYYQISAEVGKVD